MQAHIVKVWLEMNAKYLLDGPPKRSDYEGVVLLNRCEVRRTKQTERIIRRPDVEVFRAETKRELDEKIAALAQRNDVRLLTDDTVVNDFSRLPREQNNPPKDVIDGTADIYQAVEDDQS